NMTNFIKNVLLITLLTSVCHAQGPQKTPNSETNGKAILKGLKDTASYIIHESNIGAKIGAGIGVAAGWFWRIGIDEVSEPLASGYLSHMVGGGLIGYGIGGVAVWLASPQKLNAAEITPLQITPDQSQKLQMMHENLLNLFDAKTTESISTLAFSG